MSFLPYYDGNERHGEHPFFHTMIGMKDVRYVLFPYYGGTKGHGDMSFLPYYDGNERRGYVLTSLLWRNQRTWIPPAVKPYLQSDTTEFSQRTIP